MPDLLPVKPSIARHAVVQGLIEEGEALSDLNTDLPRVSMESWTPTAAPDKFRIHGGYEFRARVRSVLFGLGFREEEFGLPVTALSGGQRTRLMLALVLLQDADLILLDEPENHLDIAAREWLEAFLQESPKAFVIVSHDRRTLTPWFTRIDEIERGQCGVTRGIIPLPAPEDPVARTAREGIPEQQEFIEKEQRWIERFRYKNTKASQARAV